MLAALLLFLAAPAETVSPRYADCVNLVEADLELGRIAAQQWVGEGGGAEARHCLSIADLKAGFPKLAALRLEEISQRKDAGDDYVRARLLSQAAEAWLEGEEPDRAEDALNQALALVPDSAELQLTAAKVYAAQNRWQEVVTAVSTAEEGAFVSAETYVLRGKGRLIVGDYERAADDVVAALTLDPVNVDALVLRGDLAQVGINIGVSLAAPGEE
ncbi:tetratricopeptide repeat protein [Hyphococcus sp.]|uniref:tetratricopeptide repeat protein n=1 Tax=Hyphococcus sp. TaxID=2038636 RepID=UPI0035C6C765